MANTDTDTEIAALLHDDLPFPATTGAVDLVLPVPAVPTTSGEGLVPSTPQRVTRKRRGRPSLRPDVGESDRTWSGTS
jgi:hypothetical protein